MRQRRQVLLGQPDTCSRFSGLCATTSGAMTVLEYDGHLDVGQSDDHSFTAQQELVYDIEEVCRSDL